MTGGEVLVAVALLALAAILVQLLRSAVDPPLTTVDLLVRAVDDARVHPRGDDVLIDGRHGGERVWLEQSSAVPGTICRVACVAPPALRGTIKAGEAGGPPRLVGVQTSTLPDALMSDAGQALRTLLARCPFVRVRASEVEVLVEDTRAVPAVIDALAGLARALRGAAQPAMQVELRERAQVSPDCPYCREALGELESIACGGCGTQHHVACLLEHGRCTVLACGAGRVQRPSVERGR